MWIPTGEDLKAVRKKRALTQAELAKRADVSQPLIARIENEDVDPTIGTLHEIVSALNDSDTSIEEKEIELALPTALKDARKQARYTQRELAEQTGVSQPLISRIEQGNLNPRASTLQSLFDNLGSISILDDTDTETVRSSQPTDVLSQIESDFANLSNDNPELDAETDTKEDSVYHATQSCDNCETDLNDYPDPTFCPNCGAEIGS